jgi:hypothetical protein
MSRYFAALCFIVGALSIAHAQLLAPIVNFGKPRVSCSQATTVNNALDGSQNKSAVTALICGMVADGTYSLIDGLYVGATNSIGNSEVNWAKPGTFNLTSNGTITFAANVGWTGDGSSGYFSTGYTPATSGQQALNSAALGVCHVNARSTSANYVSIGADSPAYEFIAPFQGSSTASTFEVNSSNFPTITGPTNIQGSYIVSRTSSLVASAYVNGSLNSSPSDVSAGIPAFPIFLLAFDNSGSSTDWSADEIAYGFIAGGLTGIQVGTVYARLHAYLQAVGETSAC